MNHSLTNNTTFRLQKAVILCSTIIFLLSSCKKEVIIVQPDKNATEIVLLLPESTTSNNLTLAAEVSYLNNNDIVLSHGFLVDGISGETYINKEYPISTDLKPGRFTFEVPDPDIYKEGFSYIYKYFVKTDKGLYTSKFSSFSMVNLKVETKRSITTTAGETITVDGDFMNVEGNYDLVYSYYTYQEFKIPFEIINSGKNIRFTVPEGLDHGTNVTFRLINKDDKKPYSGAIVAEASIIGTLPIPNTYVYFIDDLVDIPYESKEYYGNNELKVFVGNVFLKYSNYLRIIDFVSDQKGKTFPMGYTNGRDTITFPEPLRLIEPDPDDFSLTQEYVHPGTKFEVTGPDPEKFNFYGYVTVGGKVADYFKRDNGSEKRDLNIGDIPEGDYAMEMNNNHFSYKSKNKIKVRNVRILSSSQSICYTGDIIKLKGAFIKGKSYGITLDQDKHAAAMCNVNGEIDFEVPLMKPGSYQIKVGYSSEMGAQKSYTSNHYPLEIKKTSISSMYPLQATSGSLITIDGRGLKGFNVRIGDLDLRQVVSQNDKIQFEIPANLPKGRYMVTIGYSTFMSNDTILTADYIEIN